MKAEGNKVPQFCFGLSTICYFLLYKIYMIKYIKKINIRIYGSTGEINLYCCIMENRQWMLMAEV